MRISHIIYAAVMTVMTAAGLPDGAQTDRQESILLYHGGRIVFSDMTANADSLAFENNGETVSLYDRQGNLVFSMDAGELDSMTFRTVPKADLLDVEFKNDGTAVDASPMGNIIKVGEQAPETYYNTTLGRFVGKFDNAWGAANTYCYYRTDYQNNRAFMDALADGHTLEALVRPQYDGKIKDAECKFFSSHEAGGTGLMVCRKANGLSNGNELTFLTNVSVSGSSSWQWAPSGVTPESETWYHVVGVYDKAAGKINIYVNGELKHSADVRGSYVFQKQQYRWFSIGGDAGPTGQLGWNGDIALARIYGTPLTHADVTALWNGIKDKLKHEKPDLVSETSFLRILPAKSGALFSIRGKGFEQGDKIRIYKVDGSGDHDATVSTIPHDKGISIRLPEGMTDGLYRLMLIRGQEMQDLGTIIVDVMQTLPKGSRTVAHRGYWNTGKSAQNSRTALRKAIEAGLYGVETDVWLNADGELFLNHDASFNGVDIKTATSEQCGNLVLTNGETMPRLSDYFDIMKECGNGLKLFIEIKDHDSDVLNRAAATATVMAVKAAGMEQNCEYKSFNRTVCEQIMADDPDARVAYLKGDLTPEELQGKGYACMDYEKSILRKNPQWILKAHNLGLTVNAWTVNTMAEMIEMSRLGADYITTDEPEEADMLREYLDCNK